MPKTADYLRYGMKVALGWIPRPQTAQEQSVSSLMRLAHLVEGPFGLQAFAGDDYSRRFAGGRQGRVVDVSIERGQEYPEDTLRVTLLQEGEKPRDLEVWLHTDPHSLTRRISSISANYSYNPHGHDMRGFYINIPILSGVEPKWTPFAAEGDPREVHRMAEDALPYILKTLKIARREERATRPKTSHPF